MFPVSMHREQLILNLILYDNSGILDIHYKFLIINRGIRYEKDAYCMRY